MINLFIEILGGNVISVSTDDKKLNCKVNFIDYDNLKDDQCKLSDKKDYEDFKKFKNDLLVLY